MAQNRTMNFYGYAYGNTPVSLTANINGTTVFSGAVSTQDQPLPTPNVDLINAPVLFSVPDTSGLFPTDFAGAYPMSITVTGGAGIAMRDVYCNYMDYPKVSCQGNDCTIDGTTLTMGNVTVGNVMANIKGIGQRVVGRGVAAGTTISALSTDGVTVQVTPSQSVAGAVIQVLGNRIVDGSADVFLESYNGVPSNSEGTPDNRSSVEIDGVPQVPPNPVSRGQWTWVVPSDSTIFYALNVSLANIWAPGTAP